MVFVARLVGMIGEMLLAVAMTLFGAALVWLGIDKRRVEAFGSGTRANYEHWRLLKLVRVSYATYLARTRLMTLGVGLFFLMLGVLAIVATAVKLR